MSKISPSIPEILQILRNENKIREQISILTYLHSNVERIKLLQTINEIQYVELCELLLALIVRHDGDKINVDTGKKIGEVAQMALHSVLEFNNYDVNIFRMLLNIERKDRVKVLEFLNRIEMKIMVRIIQHSTTIDFINDCLQMIQPSVMKWIAADSCKENIQPLIEAETQILSHEQESEERLISHILTMLYRLYEYATIESSDINIERFHPLLFDRVMTLAYMGHKRQRIPALKLLNQSLNTNLVSHMKDKYSSSWLHYKNTLQNTCCTRMSLLVKSGDDDWVNQWCLSIRILGTDLHRGAELINKLLSVEEKAFKSTDMTVRKKAFEAWKHLIDNFALNTTELTSLRRIKLLCIPLNAKNSKIETVAIAKFETWWHLIVKLYLNVDKSVNQVIEQFLNFCFGPLGDTPLLSKKCDVVVSPGKRFSVTKLMAIDALLQLLIQNSTDRHSIPRFIEERLPKALPNAIFQASYKCLFHCVGEAMLLINELDEGELNNRKELNRILWANLMIYIKQSSTEHKDSMYKEFILILKEIMSHITEISLIIDLFGDIVPEFLKITHHLIYNDNILMDVLLKLLSPELLRSADKKYLNDLTHLICHTIKPQCTKLYHCQTLPFIKEALFKMELLMEHEVYLCVFELWCTFAEIMIEYIEQNQQINEGTAINHNFETIQLLIIFPIRNIFWWNPGPILKIAKLWRELYKQFEMQIDMVATVKPNEILHDITTEMERYIKQDKKCYRIIAHCFDILINTINYETFLSDDGIPPLIKLLNDVTIFALNEIAVYEIELSLKATSSLLITVYGLNQKCTLMYLRILKPSIESMLKAENIKSIEKEMVNIWETVVIIFRGLTNFLSPELISSYQMSILLALRHQNQIIAEQAASLINIRTNSSEEIKSLLDEIERIFQKTPSDRTISLQINNEDLKKNVKMTGSFLNRKLASPKIVTTMRKTSETKKLRVPSPLPSSESNSHDYVIIKNNVKLDINRLTEHQKESLKRHRDDIPAMYNDLSQSASHNTQQLEDWFKNRSEVPNAGNNNHKNDNDVAVMDGDANKENNLTSCIKIIDNNEKLNERTMEKKVEENKSHVMNQMDLEFDEISRNETNVQMSISADDEINITNKKENIETKVHNSHIIGEKTNDDSRRVFPAENEVADSTLEHCLQLKIEKSHIPQTIVTETGLEALTSCSIESDENTESQSLESLHTMRRGRSRSKPIKTNEKSFRSTRHSDNDDNNLAQNLKRKSAFHNGSQGYFTHKRRRYSTIPQLSSTTTSNVENFDSTESKNNNNIIEMPYEDLSKRTKKEMSRLQINMVFNSRMPSKLRSKPIDDYIYGNNKRRQKHKGSDRNASQNGSSQELVKHRKPRETRSLPDVKTDSMKTTTQVELLESNKLNSKVESNIEIEMYDKDKQKSDDASDLNEPMEMHENSNFVEDTKIIDGCNNSNTSNQRDSIRNQSTIDHNYNIDRIEDEEVIESSQTTTTIIRSPHQRNNDEHSISFDFSMKNSPEKRILHKENDATLLTSNLITQQAEKSWISSSHEKTNETITLGSNFSSPKTVKRLSRSKLLTSQGRAAHMLDLVTKLAIVEKNESNENIQYLEDEMCKKLRHQKELEVDGVRKERTSILKEPERISSPSGTRQEKIFNNMKSKDYMSSPPSKLFSNLKNNGEKVSPKFEKTMSTESTKTCEKDHDTESKISCMRDELPLLEWSNANPPSLTASPSVSILKRQRQIISDIDIDTTASKKKRVSFTDPPVSKEMGYEVISEQSPIKVNKFGQPRNFLQRKDSPNKMKLSKFRTIQIDVEKSDLPLNDESKTYTLSNVMKNSHEENKVLTNKAHNFVEKSNDSSGINDNKDAVNSSVDETNNTPDENVNTGNLLFSSSMTINDIDEIDHVSSFNLAMMEKIQPSSSSTIGKESVVKIRNSKIHAHEDGNNCSNDAMNVNELSKSLELQTNNHTDLSKFNITYDTTIVRILDGSSDSSKSNNLEDTVDIQNVSNLNLTANSDELFDGKLSRMSTQIAAMTTIAQSETLPVTDSMFLSETISQDSLATQQSLAMPLPHTMDMTHPICPKLLSCNNPIDVIINDLVNPLWTKNLSKYFAARNINTIGDLAQMSEREVARFPVKGSPKVTHVKEVLNKFSLTHMSQLENQTIQRAAVTTNNAICDTPRMNEKCLEILNEQTELISNSNFDDSDNNFTTNLSEIFLSSVNSVQADNNIEEQNTEIEEKTAQKCVNSIQSNDFGSIILDKSISSSPKNLIENNSYEKFCASSSAKIENSLIANLIEDHISTSETKFETKQMDLEKLLEEIDLNLLLQSAIERSAPEDIMAQFMIKMKHKSDAEFTKDTLRLLGLKMCKEIQLKNACREIGLKKVLERLPAIFHTDNEFFTKVLDTYRMKITADDYMNALDLNQIKKAICNKFTSSELCDMLSTVLNNEARNNINTPITEISSLNAMLKRMPMDSIISHTVANDELIPSSFVLEIALQNNNSDTITHALDAQFPNIVENIMDRNMCANRIISFINKSQLSKDKLLNIYRAICDKLSSDQILDAYHEVMKEKLNFLNNDS